MPFPLLLCGQCLSWSYLKWYQVKSIWGNLVPRNSLNLNRLLTSVNEASVVITDRLAEVSHRHLSLISINITAYYEPRKSVFNKYHKTTRRWWGKIIYTIICNNRSWWNMYKQIEDRNGSSKNGSHNNNNNKNNNCKV